MEPAADDITAGIIYCASLASINLAFPLELLLDSSSESSDSDSTENSSSEEEDAPVVTSLEKVQGYAETTVPLQNPTQFREHFRMMPATFQHLLEEIAGHLANNRLPFAPGRQMIDVSKQLLIGLWVLANKESFRSVADRFGVAKSSAWVCCQRVCRALMELNREQGLISWPNAARTRRIIEGFRGNRGFPGTVGAIDGCHIPIPGPKEHRNSYINRKGFPSILLQGVCDDQMLFIDCYAGEVGSLHDANVYSRSDLSERIRNGDIQFDAENHLIGDSAYALSMTMMVPFRDNGHRTDAQRNFNIILSRSRSVIERAFGLLKGRFRRLKYLDMTKVEDIPLVIVCCCILHNVCLLQGEWEWVDPDVEDDFNDGGDSGDDEEEEGNNGVQNIVQNRQAAVEKRDALTLILRNRNH